MAPSVRGGRASPSACCCWRSACCSACSAAVRRVPARPLEHVRVFRRHRVHVSLTLLRTACLAALVLLAVAIARPAAAAASTWLADNGNGTSTHPIFYDEFSDPDLIRVGDWFYMTGTTMHAVPGLPVLRSRDLVNWELVSYAMPTFPEGPEYRLEDGKDLYGQGIWAPCLRYHDGRFHIFANVNERGLQVFTATDPAGPWTHSRIDRNLHDLSVLFDDDGRVWAVYDYN